MQKQYAALTKGLILYMIDLKIYDVNFKNLIGTKEQHIFN